MASDEASATPKPVPAAPTGLAASARDRSAVLTWTKTADTTVTGYEYQQKTGGSFGSTWTAIPDSDKDTAAYTVKGLTNNTAYQFRIRAVNSYGNGTPSAEVSATPVPPPAAPTGLTATPKSAGALLDWDNANDATITGWQFRYKTTGGYTAWYDIIGSDANTMSHAITGGLNNGTAYTFQVRAVNPSGNGAPSSEATATPQPAPAAPSLTSATPSASGQVTLDWTYSGSIAATGWQYRASQVNNGLTAIPGNGEVTLRWTTTDSRVDGWKYSTDGGSTWTAVPNADSNSRSYTVTGLTNATEYTFKIQGTQGGSDLGAEQGPTKATPTTSGGWTDISGASTRSHDVTGLTDDTTYSFRLRGVNAYGKGAASNPLTATVIGPPAKPAGLSASPGDAQATLSWIDPNNAAITGYQYRYKTTGDYGSWADMKKLVVTLTANRTADANGQAALSWTNPNLSKVEKYEYRKRAGAAAWGAWTQICATSGDSTCPGKTSYTVTTGLTANTAYDFQVRAVSGDVAGLTSYVVTGLTNNTAHTFKIRAATVGGDGPESDESSAVTPRAAPTAPSLTVTAGNRQASLSWTNPSDTSITKYQYRKHYGSTTETAWTDICATSQDSACPDKTSHTVTGLTAGIWYQFDLRAVNDLWNGPAATATVLPYGPPAKPTGLTAAAWDQRVTLSWSSAETDNRITWEYRHKSKPAGNNDYGSYGNWTAISGSTLATRSHTVTGLTNGTAYKFQVRAVISDAEGTASDESSEATPMPPSLPGKPQGFTATPGNTEATLKWDSLNDYTVTTWQYSKDNGASWSDISGSGFDTTSYTVTGLINGTAYTFKVRAVNVRGAGTASAAKTATPQTPPDAPKKLAATPSDRSVTLTWEDPNNANITRWQYRYGAETKTWEPDSGWSNACVTAYDSGCPSVTTVGVSPLTNNERYKFQVRYVTAGGASSFATVYARPVAAKPAAPDLFFYGVAATEVSFNWRTNSTVWVDKWQFQQDGGTWKDMPDSSNATRSHTALGLTLGQTYTFSVRGVNAHGNGAASPSKSVTTTPAVAPANAPTGFTAAAGDAQATLRWTAYTPAAEVTGYQYRYKTTVGYGSWKDIPGGQPATSVVVTGLTNGAAHTFQLRAVNKPGGGPEATSQAVTPLPPLPGQPTGLSAKAGIQKVTLTWTNPNNDTITGYEYRQKTGNTWGSWTDIPNSDKDTTSFDRTGLTNNTTYGFKIRVTNMTGEGPESAEVTATPRALPAKPTGLSASPNNRQVTLSWTSPNDASIEKWQYQYKTVGDYGNWRDMTNSGASTKSHAVSPLYNNVTHAFKIRAVNVSGSGPASDEATARPVPGAPEAPSLSATGGNAQVALSWSKGGTTHVGSWQYRQKKGTGNYGSWTPVPSSSDTTTSYTVSSLENGATYTFQVRGVNTSGNGSVSGEASAATLPAKPSNPTAAAKTGKTAVLYTEGQVDLTWTNPDNDSITAWQYQYKSKPDGGNYGSYGAWTNMTPSASGSNLTFTITGLTHGTAYKFKVRAVNAAGNGEASNESSETKPALPTPAKPTGFTAARDGSTATLSWSNPNNSTITGWKYRQKEGNTWGSWTEIQNSGKDTTSAEVTGLAAGDKAYTFKVRAVNATGDGDESDEKTVRQLPAKPTGLSASPNNRQVRLNWTNPNDASIEKWQYQYKTVGQYGNWTDVTLQQRVHQVPRHERPHQQRHPYLQDSRRQRQRPGPGVRRGHGPARAPAPRKPPR